MHEPDSSARDLFADKVSRGIFNPVVRHLHDDIRDDRLAEGVAQTFELFTRKAERGVVLDDALLIHACRLRAVDLGRHFAKGTHSKRDVLDERNSRDRLEVLNLGDDAITYAAPLAINPTETLVSAVDLKRWLSTLCARDQLMLALRYAGHTLGEIAERIAASTSAVFARLRELGRDLASRIEWSPT